MRLLVAAPLSALALLLGATPAMTASAASRPYEMTPGSERTPARFVVTYAGSGTYRTTFTAQPPNPGGGPDSNRARDSSTQRWALTFRRTVAIPLCGQFAPGQSDPCARLEGPTGAKGATTVTGRINHVHVDGLFDALDRTVKCRLRYTTPRRMQLAASIGLRYDARSRAISVTAYEPVSDALTNLPQSCRQGDSIDRILDSYFTPGFSFAAGYGPARWFTRTVEIPARAFHRAKAIKIPLANTAAGAPPRACAVLEPTYERCRTGGAWSGLLTFSRVGA